MSDDPNTTDFWEANYRAGPRRWELGEATPVFRRLAASGEFAPGRMIVPGAGLGDDARLFARHGYRVTAVDFAPTAARAMYARQDPTAPIIVLQADWFALPPVLSGVFDYVLEYVFITAIDPSRREAYADVVAGLLSPGGRFIGLLGPIGGPPGGPPFAVRPDDIINLLAARGLSLLRREFPPDSVPRRQNTEELVVMAKWNHDSTSPTTINRSLSSSKGEPS
mgnify:CR=1 FL=1